LGLFTIVAGLVLAPVMVNADEVRVIYDIKPEWRETQYLDFAAGQVLYLEANSEYEVQIPVAAYRSGSVEPKPGIITLVILKLSDWSVLKTSSGSYDVLSLPIFTGWPNDPSIVPLLQFDFDTVGLKSGYYGVVCMTSSEYNRTSNAYVDFHAPVWFAGEPPFAGTAGDIILGRYGADPGAAHPYDYFELYEAYPYEYYIAMTVTKTGGTEAADSSAVVLIIFLALAFLPLAYKGKNLAIKISLIGAGVIGILIGTIGVYGLVKLFSDMSSAETFIPMIASVSILAGIAIAIFYGYVLVGASLKGTNTKTTL